MKIWNVFNDTGNNETVRHCEQRGDDYHSLFHAQLSINSDVVAVSFRADGEQLAASSLDGTITFWIMTTMQQIGMRLPYMCHLLQINDMIGSIDARHDVLGGRLTSDLVTAKHKSESKCFTSLCYTADGSCILAGGNSKYGTAPHWRIPILCKTLPQCASTKWRSRCCSRRFAFPTIFRLMASKSSSTVAS